MEKQEILAKTAELLTANWIAPFDEYEFEIFSEMTDEERRIYIFIDGKQLPNKTMYKLYKKEDNIVLARKVFHYKFMRNRFFIVSKYDTVFTITPKRVFMNNAAEATYVLRALYHFDIQISIKNNTELRKFILKGELPEPWNPYPDERMTIKNNFGPTELKVFTTNEDVIIDRMIGNYDLRTLIKDMIFQCKALNVKINSEWSDRRLQDQHQKWTSEMNKLRHRNCSESPIWNIDNISIPDYMELINSERRCADEGDNMHHCLYSCYNYKIQSKHYMAFHVKSETGDFTVGIRRDYKNTVCFDQAFKAYNKEITNDDKAMLNKILEMAQSIVDRNVLRDALINHSNDEAEYFDFHY